MEHIHVDEQKFEADLRSVFAASKADPARHTPGAMVLDRNRELSIQFAMLICREVNRGSEIDHILEAGIDAFIEFASNMADNAEDEYRGAVVEIIATSLFTKLGRVVSGRGYDFGKPATFTEVKGGRA